MNDLGSQTEQIELVECADDYDDVDENFKEQRTVLKA